MKYILIAVLLLTSLLGACKGIQQPNSTLTPAPSATATNSTLGDAYHAVKMGHRVFWVVRAEAILVGPGGAKCLDTHANVYAQPDDLKSPVKVLISTTGEEAVVAPLVIVLSPASDDGIKGLGTVSTFEDCWLVVPANKE